MLVDKYNPIEHILVTNHMVQEWKERIRKQLEHNKYIHIGEVLNKIQQLRLEYNSNNYNEKIKELSAKISDFMAFQEALFVLMIEGIIMPVNLTYASSYSDYRIKISCIESGGNCSTSSERDFSMPILVYDRFMLRPSLRE